MICRVNNRPPAGRAFTLFEVMLVLAIIAAVFLSVVPVIAAGYKERRLRDTMDTMVEFVRESRRQSEETGRERLLVVQPGGLAIREGGKLLPGVAAPSGVALSVRAPQGEWARADDQEWRIFSCGLVTPASLRMQDGQAWIETDFDFLTGGVAEERYSF